MRLLVSKANVVHGGFADTLELYTKSLRDRLLVEQDPQLCNVIAQRAEESSQWRSVVLPHTGRRERPNKKKKRFGEPVDGADAMVFGRGHPLGALA